MTIKVFDVHFEALQSFHQTEGNVGVEIVSPPLKLGVRIRSDLDDQVARISVHVRLALGVKLVLHPVHHSWLYLHLEVMFFRNKSEQRSIIIKYWPSGEVRD